MDVRFIGSAAPHVHPLPLLGEGSLPAVFLAGRRSALGNFLQRRFDFLKDHPHHALTIGQHIRIRKS